MEQQLGLSRVVGVGASAGVDVLMRVVETLSVGVPEDGEPVRPGRIYVAPPDRHLTDAYGDHAAHVFDLQSAEAAE
jgi:chemotaxis response regulator CheB